MLPDSAPLAADVERSVLAERFDLSGAEIRQVALRAASVAVSAARSVQMDDLLAGCASRARVRRVGFTAE
jgi:hypothetical protein